MLFIAIMSTHLYIDCLPGCQGFLFMVVEVDTEHLRPADSIKFGLRNLQGEDPSLNEVSPETAGSLIEPCLVYGLTNTRMAYFTPVHGVK